MSNSRWFGISLLILIALILQGSVVSAQEVVVIDIAGEVDLGMGPYVQRGIDEATEAGASAILFHVNTHGGRVDVATEIRDAILASSVPTIAFIDQRAISAGALISLAAEKVVMAPGGTIGAATPVYGTGEKAPEKVVSYMRGEMRATAERRGRNPLIAEAMVDESIDLPDSTLKQEGQLLTLTTEEALDLEFIDATAPDIEAALGAVDIKFSEVRRIDSSFAEGLVSTLTAPFLSSILIMLGLGGLFYTVKTGHIGTMALVGIGSLGLFFGAQYIVDLATMMEIILFGLGIVLLLLEVFVVPGFGVAGISGILLMVASLFLALVGSFDILSVESLSVPLYTLAGAFIGLAVISVFMIKYLPNSSAFRRFALMEEPTQTRITAGSLGDLQVGVTGQTVTALRPSGTVEVNGNLYDVVSEGAFIGKDTAVTVVEIEGRRIVVRTLASES